MLPAILRIQSFRGRKKTSCLPAAVAMMAAKLIASPVRAIAIHCQSTRSLSATVNIAITEKEAAPSSMQTYGSALEPFPFGRALLRDGDSYGLISAGVRLSTR